MIERLEQAGYPVVFHVHDEVVIDGAGNLSDVLKLMTESIPWAKNLLLNADGWVDNFFRKD